ncbi:MAG: hypothetical protein ACI9XC_002568, partial [Gammaproteobacteria bacterium]
RFIVSLTVFCNWLFLIDFFIYFVGIPQAQAPKGTSTQGHKHQ